MNMKNSSLGNPAGSNQEMLLEQYKTCTTWSYYFLQSVLTRIEVHDRQMQDSTSEDSSNH